MNCRWGQFWRWLSTLTAGVLLLAGCAALTVPSAVSDQTTGVTQLTEDLSTLADLTAVELNGKKLRVVATTNLVGDVVAQIGGNRIEIATLLLPGVDPHAYQLAPTDRQLLEDAHVIFVNGLGLEESILPVLDDLKGRVPVVAVNTGIVPLQLGEQEEESLEEHETEDDAHHHERVDPHTWHSVPNVIIWTENIETVLGALDPAQAEAYTSAAVAYRSELESLNVELHALVDTLPKDQRKLVTDHDSMQYLAHEYGFQVVGTVIPSVSTLTEASAQQLAALQTQITAEAVKTIFVGTTVNPALVEQFAGDLGIRIMPLYNDSLSDATGPASTYLEFMRYNFQTIVEALR